MTEHMPAPMVTDGDFASWMKALDTYGHVWADRAERMAADRERLPGLLERQGPCEKYLQQAPYCGEHPEACDACKARGERDKALALLDPHAGLEMRPEVAERLKKPLAEEDKRTMAQTREELLGEPDG